MTLNYTFKYWFVALLICSYSQSYGQWMDDFSSNDLSVWSGDIDVFKVNESGQLQLDAPGAGEAYIYRSSSIDFDTVSFTMFHLMDFSPSDNNKSRIYLALDNENPTNASGYFIEIGENGSADALNFYYLEGGSASFIGGATMGAMASEPSVVRIEIDIYPNGLWSIKTNYEGEQFTSLELEFLDDRFSFKESQFFGLECKFSASRADKFFYDDLSLVQFVPDTTPPSVTEAVTLNANQVLVTFSEPVELSDAVSSSNYSIDNGIGSPSSIVDVGDLNNQFQLTFTQSFDASFFYLLTIMGISDLNENQMNSQTVPLFFAEEPEKGDIFISEILFDPYPNGEDFIEIYNRSGKNLDLNGVQIRNVQNEVTETIGDVTIPPGTYIAFSEDTDFLIQEYKPDASANIEFQEIPALNNDMGNVTIINSQGVVLDSFDYNEDQHFQLIDDVEGVSLERISFDVPASDLSNWQSAAESVRFATPGYQNSNGIVNIANTQNFTLQTETFSPNQDGDDDLMVLSYVLEKSGFVINLNVYDAAGHLIKELTNNELLGNQGIITWDGTDDDNQLGDLGIYIIAGTAFHPDGETINLKLTIVLADFID